MKKTEERMMEKIEEKKMEERARQLLEDPVDDDEETGDPSTCLEAMQGLECPERNFCISLIAQWLAPKWLVASKAAAIEVSPVLLHPSVRAVFRRFQIVVHVV